MRYDHCEEPIRIHEHIEPMGAMEPEVAEATKRLAYGVALVHNAQIERSLCEILESKVRKALQSVKNEQTEKVGNSECHE